MTDVTIGFALCGSFCTFSQVIPKMKELKEKGFTILPIMSQIAYSTDTRFGKAADIVGEIEEICGNKVISTIQQAEPIGPKKLLDVLVVAPCTGNTLGKMANGITDTSVTMAAKSHLRNQRPVILGISTNDALGAAAKNIGQLLNYKNIYFIPMKQDDFSGKPNSVVSDFALTYDAITNALDGRQLQPLLV